MAFDPDVLDDPVALEAADPRAVLRSLAGAGAQVRQALELDLQTRTGIYHQRSAEPSYEAVIAPSNRGR